MIKWESLVSIPNLRLAWRRINTGKNLQYKRFFRDSYLAYESAHEEHIKDLHDALIAKVWQPNHATRIYLPKPSGLQRPISLLDIESQVVLQAIANKFASKLRRKRQRVELESVFSNKLASTSDSIFFMERWQTTYNKFQEKCLDVFNQGFRWSAHFDLSAYYDTISHDLLLSIAAPNAAEPETSRMIKGWFRHWSAADSGSMTGHGIPQGPIASDFLAEAFFLPIDVKMQKHSFSYIRYVDDIRLFGKTENEVIKAAILLEQECRHRGLIPQSSKFIVIELKSAQDAMGVLPSIAPTDSTSSSVSFMTKAEAKRLLGSAVNGRPKKVKDKSRFRFVMYRAPSDPMILRVVLRLLPRHPEHIDAFIAYFSNYGRSKAIVDAALDYLEQGVPYSYVRGELWHLIARLGGHDDYVRGLPMARVDAKNRSECVALSWGVMHFLIRCEKDGLVRNGQRIAHENPFSRSLLVPIFHAREFVAGGKAEQLLKGTLMEQLAACREMQKRGVSLNSLGLRQRNLPASCTRTLKAFGVIRRQRTTQRDWVAELLAEIYGCEQTSIWRSLLEDEYEHALLLLVEAKVRFLSGAHSEWLGLQDSLGDIVTRQFIKFLGVRGLPGSSSLIASNGKMVKYGSLLQPSGPLDRTHPDITLNLREIHSRRNKLPGSHPYDEKGGARNRWLSKPERDLLAQNARTALNEISSIIQMSQG